MKLWGLNLRTWLTSYLQACADNGNTPPVAIDAFLPWQMDADRLVKMRTCHLQEVLSSS
jgi:transposase